MPGIEKFEDLEVWKKAHQIVIWTYQITSLFPKEEQYTLTSQMRRSAISVPANIAEGFKKQTLKDKRNFYNIAQGSLEELRYYIILSKDLGYLNYSQDLSEMIEETGKMLHGLINNSRQDVVDYIREGSSFPTYCLLSTTYYMLPAVC